MVYAIIAAILFFLTLCCTTLIAAKAFENTWYAARAVAESTKTRTWRYVMRATPYESDGQAAQVKFTEDLREILRENRRLATALSDEAAIRDAITAKMSELRNLDWGERLTYYKQHRIDEQRHWYSCKATSNRVRFWRWLVAMICCQLIAFVCVVIRIEHPCWTHLPTGVFAAAAGCAWSWIQSKRFNELATSYGLAAHEISIIVGAALGITEEAQLSSFVVDSENAFSREHTQWAARRGC